MQGDRENFSLDGEELAAIALADRGEILVESLQVSTAPSYMRSFALIVPVSGSFSPRLIRSEPIFESDRDALKAGVETLAAVLNKLDALRAANAHD